MRVIILPHALYCFTRFFFKTSYLNSICIAVEKLVVSRNAGWQGAENERNSSLLLSLSKIMQI